MSYLINVKTNELIAYTSKALKSGERVQVSFDRTKNALNANREFDLVNSFECKASNAKKWGKISENYFAHACTEINENEFYI